MDDHDRDNRVTQLSHRKKKLKGIKLSIQMAFKLHGCELL